MSGAKGAEGEHVSDAPDDIWAGMVAELPKRRKPPDLRVGDKVQLKAGWIANCNMGEPEIGVIVEILACTRCPSQKEDETIRVRTPNEDANWMTNADYIEDIISPAQAPSS